MSDKMTFNSYRAIISDHFIASYKQKSKVIQKKSENNRVSQNEKMYFCCKYFF